MSHRSCFSSFADAGSEQRREQAFQRRQKSAATGPLDRTAWLAAHPTGYVEYRDALRANAPYGAGCDPSAIVAEIDGTVFMHGGVNPEFTTDSLDNINRRARRELTEFEDGFRWLQQHDFAVPYSTFTEILDAAQAELTRLGTKRKQESLTDDDVSESRVLLPLLNIGDSSLLNPNGPLWFRGFSTWTDAGGSRANRRRSCGNIASSDS